MIKVPLTFLTLTVAIVTLSVTLPGQTGPAPVVGMQKVIPSTFNGDVRTLPQVPAPLSNDPAGTKHRSKSPGSTKQGVIAFASLDSPSAQMPSPTQNFDGLSFSDAVTGGQAGGGWPPSANGAVGRNYYVEAVDDAYAIYDKSGTRLAAFTENSLWSSSGVTSCNGNSFGDPIVVYDQLADRFILANVAFAHDINGNDISPFYECIAVAKTSDPVAGGWWLYPIRMDPGGSNLPPVSTLNDYAKFGIWTDCLYMSANGFAAPSLDYVGAEFASFSRTDLESGAPLTWTLGIISTTDDPFTMIPSNMLGISASSLPPPGTPNYFVSQSTDNFAFEVRKFSAGVNCGSGGTLSGPINVSETAYTAPAGPLVPQPNTATMLDTLEDRLMQKVQYRKVDSAESLWVVHNVQTSPSAVLTQQWAQLDVTGGTISTTPVQQQIYSPDTMLHRWMGSIAADNAGNVALGYSTSNGTAPNFPSIAYSGRLAGDPLNTLQQAETQLIAGLGSQRFNCGGAPCVRWGDYSSMSVDPGDDCTFWYVNQYYNSQTNGDAGNWQTRIGSFKFPSCTPVGAVLTISKSHTGNFAQGDIGQRYTITIGNSGSAAPTLGTVTMTDTLPSGLTATAISGTGWSCALGTLTCNRSDALASGASYPPIILTVNVAANATSPQINTASVSGGGSASTNTNDATTILPASDSTTTIVETISPEPSAPCQAYSVAYTVTSPGGTPTGNVTVTDGFGTNTCSVAAGTCSMISTSSGSHIITVTYLGNGSFASSFGTKAHDVVSGAQPTSSSPYVFSASKVNGGSGSTADPQVVNSATSGVTISATSIAQAAGTIGVSPRSGSGSVQTFTGTYTAATGYHDLQWVQMLFAVATDGGGQAFCYVHYDVQGNEFWLYSDVQGFFEGPIAPGTVSNLLQGSLCALNTSGSSVTGSGIQLTVNANVVFKEALALNIYMRAYTLEGVDTGWVQQGTWTTAPASLGTMTVAPSSGSVTNGTQQTFTLTYPDTPGFAGAAFGWEQFLAAVASDGGGQPYCYVHYDRGGNGLWMYSGDLGFFLGPVTPGTSSSLLTSSACSVNTAGATVQNTGGNLVLTLPITLKSPMICAQNLFERSLTVLNVDTGFVQAGTFAVN